MPVCMSPTFSFATDAVAELLWSTPSLIAVFDAADRLILANEAFCETYFANPAQKPSWQQIMRENHTYGRGPLIETDDIEAWLTAASTRRGTVPYRAFEAAMTDGRVFWITETVDQQGNMLVIASEITTLKAPTRSVREERDAARRASWTDDLTGIANRRYVMKTLREWLAQQLQQDVFGEHAVALIDIDLFKKVNDRYGHEFGDAVLVQFCRRFVAGTRLHDLFGRMGGEEFLLFLPSCSLADATHRLEEILDDVKSIRFAQAPGYSCSFSAGLCEVQPDKTLDETLSLADRCLYSAKARGRQCIVSGPDLPELRSRRQSTA
jgi:diguanylate cyclase (GGDEF)-like protein